jgi:S-adenosylmethionine decarboxylase
MWGLSTHIDLFGCNVAKITSREVIQRFAEELVIELDMMAHDAPSIVWFGNDDTEGYTLTQLITTSCITAHFSESYRQSAFIDIFSCKSYDVDRIVKFCTDFFEANVYKREVISRGGLSKTSELPE